MAIVSVFADKCAKIPRGLVCVDSVYLGRLSTLPQGSALVIQW